MAASTWYLAPGRPTRLLNHVVQALTRIGVSLWGSRVLSVRGRKSGEWRSTPVNVLTLDGERYLVSARGNTQWVRNLRAVGRGRLTVGRRVEPFEGVEVTDDAVRVAVLRSYLRRWGLGGRCVLRGRHRRLTRRRPPSGRDETPRVPDRPRHRRMTGTDRRTGVAGTGTGSG